MISTWGPFNLSDSRSIQYLSLFFVADDKSGSSFLSIRGPSAVLWRTVRSVFLRLRTSLQSLWWISPMNCGLSAPLPADRPRYQKSDKSEFCQFFQFQLQFGIIAHIKIQKSQILHENLQKTHMSKLQQEFKNKSSKILKTHKWLKNTSIIQKNETKSAWKNHMPHVLVFKPNLRSQWYLTHFLTCKTEIHPKAW